MKYLTLIILLFSFHAMGQSEGEAPFEEIPEVTEKIEITGKGVSIEAATFRYRKDYDYKDGITFGSKVQLSITGVENVHSVGETSFVVFRQKIIKKSDSTIILSSDWDSKRILTRDPDDPEKLIFDASWEIGSPSFTGEYIWALELANLSNGKTTKITVPVMVIQAGNMASSHTEGVSFEQAYLYNKSLGKIYSGAKIDQGIIELHIRNIEGFKLDEGLYKIGVSHKLSDDKGNIIFENPDIARGKDAYIESEDGTLYVSPSIKISGDVKGKILTYAVRIWDKRQLKAEINVLTKFIVL